MIVMELGVSPFTKYRHGNVNVGVMCMQFSCIFNLSYRYISEAIMRQGIYYVLWDTSVLDYVYIIASYTPPA